RRGNGGGTMAGTRRTPRNRPPRRAVTDKAVRLYKLGREIVASGTDDIPERDGGRRQEFDHLSEALRHELGLKLWHPDVLYSYTEELEKLDDFIWQEAIGLRERLKAIVEAEAAAAQEQAKALSDPDPEVPAPVKVGGAA